MYQMNQGKVRAVLDYVRQHGGIPTDATGRRLREDEVLVWYGLDRLLTVEERRQVKRELAALAEIQAFMEEVRLANV